MCSASRSVAGTNPQFSLHASLKMSITVRISLANFRLPGDVAASRRYYAPDLIDPEIDVRPDGTIAVPTGPGIGVTIDWNRVAAATEARLETRMNTDHGSTPTTDDHGSTRKAEPPKART